MCVAAHQLRARATHTWISDIPDHNQAQQGAPRRFRPLAAEGRMAALATNDLWWPPPRNSKVPLIVHGECSGAIEITLQFQSDPWQL